MLYDESSDKSNDEGRNAYESLIDSIRKGDVKTSVSLIEKGVNISGYDTEEHNAFSVAIQSRNMQIAEMLMIITDPKYVSNTDALLVAAYIGDIEQVQLLVQLGAKISKDTLECAKVSGYHKVFEILSSREVAEEERFSDLPRINILLTDSVDNEHSTGVTLVCNLGIYVGVGTLGDATSSDG